MILFNYGYQISDILDCLVHKLWNTKMKFIENGEQQFLDDCTLVGRVGMASKEWWPIIYDY